jgi:hypothetical protein
MIIDTDAGGDLDDSVALVVAGWLVPELGLVVTGDEFGGERARFVRWLLDLVGRQDVRVVAGPIWGIGGVGGWGDVSGGRASTGDWPGVRFARERVVLDELARMSLAPDGTEIAMSVSADYPAFRAWLEQALVRR